jgi:hypothetical protein
MASMLHTHTMLTTHMGHPRHQSIADPQQQQQFSVQQLLLLLLV